MVVFEFDGVDEFGCVVECDVGLVYDGWRYFDDVVDVEIGDFVEGKFKGVLFGVGWYGDVFVDGFLFGFECDVVGSGVFLVVGLYGFYYWFDGVIWDVDLDLFGVVVEICFECEVEYDGVFG